MSERMGYAEIIAAAVPSLLVLLTALANAWVMFAMSLAWLAAIALYLGHRWMTRPGGVRGQ